MKNTKKGFVRRGAIFVLLFLLLSSAFFTACAAEDGSDESGNMTVEIGEEGVVRNGTEYRTYRVEEGYKGIVRVDIVRKSGRLDLDIYPTDSKDEPRYTGRDLDTASFSVGLDAAGEYKVRITAKEFIGDYGIDWKREEINESPILTNENGNE